MKHLTLTLLLLAASSCSKEERVWGYSPVTEEADADTGQTPSMTEGGLTLPPGSLSGSITAECELPEEANDVLNQLSMLVGAEENIRSCEEAVEAKSYVGCDFWPTITMNRVDQDLFQFHVVVANTGEEPADVSISFAETEVTQAKVAANSIQEFALPWVPALKGGSYSCSLGLGDTTRLSLLEPMGAYHLQSSRPVVAYQFSPLHFYNDEAPPKDNFGYDCNASYTNDASLLLPVQAWGTSYRAAGYSQALLEGEELSITAQKDGTTVKVYANAAIAAGETIPGIAEGRKQDYELNRGDVLRLTPEEKRISGSLIQADQPIQVISSSPCERVPQDLAACDHLEEVVPPAESLGRRYIVTPPTGPTGRPIKYALQFTGNEDDTEFYYRGDAPSELPKKMDAGDFEFFPSLDETFEVIASHSFSLTIFLRGGERQRDENTDPSQSIAIPIEQFRKKYIFLAPEDYKSIYADIIAPVGTTISLDGDELTTTREEISCSEYEGLRVLLRGNDGIHRIEASAPIGVQVVAHALYTSFMFPGGLNVTEIAPAPRAPTVR
ncbi:MAG: IgGFc-binding protein [Polyangiaceae bacterium]|nr:IgGFc-binding protein [Polyangiaceae bacterium]